MEVPPKPSMEAVKGTYAVADQYDVGDIGAVGDGIVALVAVIENHVNRSEAKLRRSIVSCAVIPATVPLKVVKPTAAFVSLKRRLAAVEPPLVSLASLRQSSCRWQCRLTTPSQCRRCQP